jgi:hypothetical protein
MCTVSQKGNPDSLLADNHHYQMLINEDTPAAW